MNEFSNVGIRECDNVALVLLNTAAFPVCLMGLLQLGANPLLLSPDTTHHEIEKLRINVNISWIIKDNDFTVFDKEIISVRNYAIKYGTGSLNIYRLVSEKRYNTEMGVILHQTSGTYGNPLVCIRNQDVAVSEAINYASSICLLDKVKIRVTTPLYHAFAYGFGLISSIITNSTIKIASSFNPKKILDEETIDKSDILCIVPPMLYSLIHLKESNNLFILPETVFYAGTICRDSLKEEFEHAFNNKLYAILGSTETGGISCNYGNTEKGNGLGKPLKNVSVLIKNAEKYKDLGDNIGELYVKSTSMMQRYYHTIQNTAEWLCTGDIARVDEKQNLHIVGRMRDILNIGGVKVDPVEVETVLTSYSGISDAVVYMGHSRDGNEIVVAALTSNSNDITEKDIINYCNKKLSKIKVPNKIFILDKLPRTNSGKYLKAELPMYYNQALNIH